MPKKVDNPPTVLYEGQKFRILQTPDFAIWLPSLRDRRAIAKITDRLLRAADGNFGDVKDAGKGVSEMRIDYGPGYRVYFSQRGNELVILLCGGDKRTQNRDIAYAQRLKSGLDHGTGIASV
jgi:putative addiction module killer protein